MTYLVIQLGVNVALILGLAFLVRENAVVRRRTTQREERLATLAAELCALGHDLVSRESATTSSPPRLPQDTSADAERQREVAPDPAPCAVEPAAMDRVDSAVSMLARGMALDTVVAETALPEGEVQVLRNLTRTAKPGVPAGRRGRSATHSPRACLGGERREPSAKESAARVERHGNA